MKNWVKISITITNFIKLELAESIYIIENLDLNKNYNNAIFTGINP